MRGRVLLLILCSLVLGAQSVERKAITRAQVEQRLVELRGQYDQAIANANALHGAIIDCEYWLQQLEPKKAEKK